MSVLIDSSVWIAYFRGEVDDGVVDFLIDHNMLVINDLILAEIIPVLRIRKQFKLVDLLMEIKCPQINIDWNDIINMQVLCLRNGINKVGISDLVIAQYSIINGFDLLTYDKHFMLMRRYFSLSLYGGINN